MSDTTAESDQTAGPFSRFEWMLAGPYLRARRKEAFISVISWLTLIGVAIGATVLSDLGWYGFGRAFPSKALARLTPRRAGRLLPWLERLFTERGAQALFASKFIYGTRVMAQLLAGLHGMPLRIYLAVNTLAIVAVTLTLTGIAVAIAHTAGWR